MEFLAYHFLITVIPYFGFADLKMIDMAIPSAKLRVCGQNSMTFQMKPRC